MIASNIYCLSLWSKHFNYTNREEIKQKHIWTLFFRQTFTSIFPFKQLLMRENGID